MSMILRGDRIETLRRKNGLTMERLADMVGVSRVYMQDLKSGKKKNASQKVVEKIAESLGCSVMYLLEEKNAFEIPLVGLVQAKPVKPSGMGERKGGKEKKETVESFPQHAIARMLALKVADDSLEPVFRKNDVLYYEAPAEDGSVNGDAIGARCVVRTVEGVSLAILHAANSLGQYGLQPVSGGKVVYQDIRWAAPIVVVRYLG